MSVLTSDDVEHFASEGWITIDEAITITNTPQIQTLE